MPVSESGKTSLKAEYQRGIFKDQKVLPKGSGINPFPFVMDQETSPASRRNYGEEWKVVLGSQLAELMRSQDCRGPLMPDFPLSCFSLLTSSS